MTKILRAIKYRFPTSSSPPLPFFPLFSWKILLEAVEANGKGCGHKIIDMKISCPILQQLQKIPLPFPSFFFFLFILLFSFFDCGLAQSPERVRILRTQETASPFVSSIPIYTYIFKIPDATSKILHYYFILSLSHIYLLVLGFN